MNFRQTPLSSITMSKLLLVKALNMRAIWAGFSDKGHFSRINSDGTNTILSISNKLEHHFSTIKRTHLLMIKLKHLDFGFERMAFARFTKSFIEQTWPSFFQTLKGLEYVHLLVIEPKHPFFGFEQSNIELPTKFDPSLISFPS